MSLRTALLIFLLVVSASPALADSRCAPLTKSPSVNIMNTPARVIYKTGYGSQDLKRLQRVLQPE